MAVLEVDKRTAGLLLEWYRDNKRPLPWRKDREPYHVWLSEIMCQQTRVETVKGYYERFLAELPTIADLASCPVEKLEKLWEGLGYYSRVRNLQKAAVMICERHGGAFPRDYASIRALPGIGNYTAAAIASICFGDAVPAVDGNVLRVVARLSGSRSDISRESTKTEVRDSLTPLFQHVSCGDLNQAFMELGALICLPNHAPLCSDCPLNALCVSSRGGWKELPVKKQKNPRKTERHTVFLLQFNDQWALRRRGEEGVLAGLWEFPNVSGDVNAQAALEKAESWGCRPRDILKAMEKRHIFTHLNWELPAWVIRCGAKADCFEWVTTQGIRSGYSLPTAFRQFVAELENL